MKNDPQRKMNHIILQLKRKKHTTIFYTTEDLYKQDYGILTFARNELRKVESIMAKKNQTEETQVETALVIPDKMTPAPILGTNTKMVIPQAMLPEEFQGQQLETIETGFAPTVKWNNPGNYVAGVYEGYEEKVGPNNAKLYQFDAKGKKFAVWGTTVLDRALGAALKTGQLKPGYLVCITYLGGIPTDFQDAKMFNIQVVVKK